MTREELREHCKKQIDMCEILAIRKGEDPHGKIYDEHKLILELLEQETVSKESYDHEYFLRKEFEIKIARLEQQEPILNKIRTEILQLKTKTSFTFVNIDDVLRVIDKHMESKENINADSN